MKQIGMLITKSEVGGAQRWVADIVNELTTDYQFHLYCDKSGWLTDAVADETSIVTSNGIRHLYSLWEIVKIFLWMRSNNLDVVFCSSANAGLFGRLAGLFTKTRVYYVSHGWSAVYAKGSFSVVYRAVECLLALISEGIICISKNDIRLAKKKIFINKKKLIYIPNSIRGSVKTCKATGKCLAVGRFAHPKRMDLVCAVFSGLPLTVDIVGGGPDLSSLKHKFDYCENINFRGEIEGFANYAAYKIFILLSDSEGMPLSALEAMNSGLPLVLSNVGGCPELISENGMLVSDDINDIREKTLFVYENAKFMGEKSAQLFEQKFAWNKTMNAYKMLIEEK